MRFRHFALVILILCIGISSAHAEVCDGESATPQLINQWDVPGDPWGVAIDPQGYVFVTDPDNHRICRYSINGENPIYFGSEGNEPGEFREPHWLAFDPVRGRLYVVENRFGYRVQAFDRNGSYLFTIGDESLDSAPGKFAGAAHGLALDADGNIFVADHNSMDDTFYDRIQVFGPDASFLRVFRTVNSLPSTPTQGEWRNLVDIEITPDGEVFLLDNGVPGSEANRVHRLLLNGSAVDIWGENGNGPGQFDYPSNLSSDNEYLWVSSGSRLLKFRRDGEFVVQLNGSASRSYEGIDTQPAVPAFLYAGSFAMGSDPERLQLIAPPIPAYNVLDSHWLDSNLEFIGDDPELLLDCDQKNLPVDAVAADGVTPVLLSYEFEVPHNVSWSLTDMNPGSVAGGIGELVSIDGSQHGGSASVTTEEVGGRHVAFVLYTAPIDFDRAGCPEDLPLEKRQVRINMDYEQVGGGGPGAYIRDLDIVRPPIVFVHGIWSREHEWNEFSSIRNDSRWISSVVDYEISHGQAFAENAPLVLAQIRGTKNGLLTNLRMAAAQVDLIVHSMGGCLARKIAGGSDYFSAGNLGQGDFHKLLTLNTPHFGSPLATALVSLRSKMGTSRMSRELIGLVADHRKTTIGQIAGGAIDDLIPGSAELSAFQRLDVPTHAHVGVGGSDLTGSGTLLESPYGVIMKSLSLLSGEPSLNEYIDKEHDIVVLAARDPEEPNDNAYAEHKPSVNRKVINIRVSSTLTPLDQVACLVYEAINAQNEKLFTAITEEAHEGAMTKSEFILNILRLEHKSLKKTLAFLSNQSPYKDIDLSQTIFYSKMSGTPEEFDAFIEYLHRIKRDEYDVFEHYSDFYDFIIPPTRRWKANQKAAAKNSDASSTTDKKQ